MAKTQSKGNFPQFIDLTGMVFNSWTVIRQVPDHHRQVYWLCRCVCGSERALAGQSLRTGNSKSCGCVGNKVRTQKATKHGLYGTGAYRSWQAMKSRCDDPNNIRYNLYGGRGIKYDSRWESFEYFFADMGQRSKNYTLERVDVNLGYSKANCIWLQAEKQAKNTRRTRRVEWRGKTMTLEDAMIIGGSELGKRTVWRRYKNGMDIESAMSIPAGKVSGR